MTNRIEISCDIEGREKPLVVKEYYPHTSEKERLAIGRKKATQVFVEGVFEETACDTVICYPPHRVTNITIRSF